MSGWIDGINARVQTVVETELQLVQANSLFERVSVIDTDGDAAHEVSPSQSSPSLRTHTNVATQSPWGWSGLNSFF